MSAAQRGRALRAGLEPMPRSEPLSPDEETVLRGLQKRIPAGPDRDVVASILDLVVVPLLEDE